MSPKCVPECNYTALIGQAFFQLNQERILEYFNGETSDGGSIFIVGRPKSNDQIFFACNPYLACPHVVTCPVTPVFVGFKPTVLVSSFGITITSKI